MSAPEGTLGVITEIQLRLYGIPEAISAAVCQFPDLESAVNTVIIAMQTGIPVARIELLDDVQMDASIRYSKLEGFAAKPTLFFEFHGTEAGVREQSAAMQAISDEFGGSAFQWATQARGPHAAVEGAARRVLRGDGAAAGQAGLCHRCLRPDIAAGRLHPRDQGGRRCDGLVAPIVGHVGDGNFHLLILFDPANAGERERAEALAKGVSMRAISMGGTCTGEHGIGWHKLDVLAQEHGEAVDLMRDDQARARPARHHESGQDRAAA